MRVRVAFVDNSIVEIEIEGGFDDLDELADALRNGGGTIACDTAGDPAPYGAALASLVVEATDDDRVRLRADDHGVRITGGADAFEEFAEMVDDLADGAFGTHVHVEWAPAHPLIGKGSIPAVLALPRPAGSSVEP